MMIAVRIGLVLVPLVLLGGFLGGLLRGGEAPGPTVSLEAPRMEVEALQRLGRQLADRVAVVEFVERAGPQGTGPHGTKGQEERPPMKIGGPFGGVVIGPQHIMTVAPDLAGRQGGEELDVRVMVGGGEARRMPARLIQADARTGLAVVQVPGLRAQALRFDPEPALAPDSTVVLVEPRNDGRPLLREGRLLQVRAHLEQGSGKNHLLLFRLSAAGEAGPPRPGSFLADSRGEFLGIVCPAELEAPPAASRPAVAGLKEAPSRGAARPQLKKGECLAIPAEIAWLLSESLARGKVPVRGYFGASFREVRDPPEELRRLGCGKPTARVEKVYPGGPADQAGLRVGDWLLAIAEKKSITYPAVLHFSELVEYSGQGKVVDVVVARESGSTGGLQPVRLKIRIGSR